MDKDRTAQRLYTFNRNIVSCFMMFHKKNLNENHESEKILLDLRDREKMSSEHLTTYLRR